MEGRDRLRAPDLLRFFGLYGYGDRHGIAARLSFSAEFPASVSGVQHHRFLASLAHVAVAVAARLSVYLSGRESPRDAKDLPESDADDAVGRIVARRELEF